MVQTKVDILSELHKHRRRIGAFGMARLALFGSFMRNQPHDNSDVDLLVEFTPDQKTYDNFIHLCFFLEDVLGRCVELLTPQAPSPYIGPRILSEVQDVPLGD